MSLRVKTIINDEFKIVALKNEETLSIRDKLVKIGDISSIGVWFDDKGWIFISAVFDLTGPLR
jgi:hypothetical protein